MKHVQQVQAEKGPRAADTAVEVSVRALLLAGAYPLVPPEKVPSSVRNPGALYGEFTPVTLLQGIGEAGQAAAQLGTAALKAASRVMAGLVGSGDDTTPTGAAAENGPGRSVSSDGVRPGSAQPAPSPTSGVVGGGQAAAAAAAARRPRAEAPRRLPVSSCALRTLCKNVMALVQAHKGSSMIGRAEQGGSDIESREVAVWGCKTH